MNYAFIPKRKQSLNTLLTTTKAVPIENLIGQNEFFTKYDLIAACDQQILKERILEPLDWVCP